MIKVFGHKSPDTDATCTAIIWAWYLQTHTGADAKPYVLGELNKETQFVLSRWNQETPTLLESVSADDEVVVVDTNNPQELFDNINEAKIIQIIDHHKLVGGLQTAGPIDFTLKPLASTASVMYDLIGGVNEELPDDIAGLMLSCVLSDTLEFRSPTTTPHDKDIAEKLANQLGVNITEYANEMFAAKSDITDFTDSGLVKLDSKKFGVGDVNLRVSVIETTTPSTVLDRKDGIVEAINEIVESENDVDEVIFFIIDILNQEATVLTHNDRVKTIIEKSFSVTVESDIEVLPGIVSRKKQILPSLKA
jgi:manganese-dependent inorganic pyrophosphatase